MATRSIRSLPSLARTIAPASPYAATTSYSVGSPYSRRQFPTSDLRTLRPFSSSSASFASEAPKDPFEHRASWQSEVPLFERLQNHPECMEAIERLAETVKVSLWPRVGERTRSRYRSVHYSPMRCPGSLDSLPLTRRLRHSLGLTLFLGP